MAKKKSAKAKTPASTTAKAKADNKKAVKKPVVKKAAPPIAKAKGDKKKTVEKPAPIISNEVKPEVIIPAVTKKKEKAKVISLEEITGKKPVVAEPKEKVIPTHEAQIQAEPQTALGQAMKELSQLRDGLAGAIRNHTGFGNLREHEVLETIRRSHDDEGYKVTFERPVENALECAVIVEERFTEGAKIRIPEEGYFQIEK